MKSWDKIRDIARKLVKDMQSEELTFKECEEVLEECKRLMKDAVVGELK